MTDLILEVVIFHFSCFGVLMIYMTYINHKEKKKD